MFKSPSHLPDHARINVADTLNARAADALDLYSQVKVAHWNVKGPQFPALHPLFDSLATIITAQIDTMAERAVTLGARAFATVRHSAHTSRLPEYPRATARDMEHVQLVAERMEIYLQALRESRDTAGNHHDTDTSDLLTQMITELEKQTWFLRATLEG
jgi:starvation-inducible DNA-binding protein